MIEELWLYLLLSAFQEDSGLFMLKKGAFWSSAGSEEPTLTKAAVPPEFQQSCPTLPCAAAPLTTARTSLESQHAQNLQEWSGFGWFSRNWDEYQCWEQRRQAHHQGRQRPRQSDCPLSPYLMPRSPISLLLAAAVLHRFVRLLTSWMP